MLTRASKAPLSYIFGSSPRPSASAHAVLAFNIVVALNERNYTDKIAQPSPFARCPQNDLKYSLQYVKNSLITIIPMPFDAKH